MGDAFGDNHKVAFVMLTGFCFIDKKTGFGRARRRKAAAFSSVKTDIDENTGLLVQHRAARCWSTIQLTGIHRRKVAKGYTKASWTTASQKRRLLHLGLANTFALGPQLRRPAPAAIQRPV